VNKHLTQARLDELWSFDDAAESERRFREELSAVAPDSLVAAELTTQLARALGLQDRFAEADELLDGITEGDGVVLTRALLERGRLRNSSGRVDAAIPLFEQALAAASAVGNDFLAVDAAHMLAIADPDHSERWTLRALETVDESRDKRTKGWGVTLHNNRGWAFAELDRLPDALVEFELAADAARDFGTEQQQAWAQEAIDEIRARIDQLAD
jgi:tetratricopeptide (TPR) repeat protein